MTFCHRHWLELPFFIRISAKILWGPLESLPTVNLTKDFAEWRNWLDQRNTCDDTFSKLTLTINNILLSKVCQSTAIDVIDSKENNCTVDRNVELLQLWIIISLDPSKYNDIIFIYTSSLVGSLVSNLSGNTYSQG